MAKELGRSPSEVALHWAVTQPGITSVIIGATKIEQLQSNLSSLDLFIPGELRKKLDDATAIDAFARAVAADNLRALRALGLIERSLDKLDGLLASARRLDEATADLLDMPRTELDL